MEIAMNTRYKNAISSGKHGFCKNRVYRLHERSQKYTDKPRLQLKNSTQALSIIHPKAMTVLLPHCCNQNKGWHMIEVLVDESLMNERMNQSITDHKLSFIYSVYIYIPSIILPRKGRKSPCNHCSDKIVHLKYSKHFSPGLDM